MPASIDALIPFLAFCSSTVGAGILASRLLDRARRQFPTATRGQVAAWPRLKRLCYTLLYTPQYARASVFVVAALISLSSNAILAYAQGTDVRLATDAALALIISQLRHGLSLPDAPQFAADRRGWTQQNEQEFRDQ